MSNSSQEIDAIIASTPDWRGATLAKLRTIIHEADPQMTETVKWKKPSNPMGAPVFVDGRAFQTRKGCSTPS